MVFYFSGTGNSKWVAVEIAKAINEEVADITELKRKGLTTYAAGEDEKVGFVFPVHAWGTPRPMLEYAEAVQLRPGTYTFGVCTCAEEAGNTINKLAKKVRLNSGYSVIMPNNYILGADADNEAVAESKVRNAKVKIAMIIDHVKKQDDVFDYYKGTNAFIKSGFIHFFFDHLARRGTGSFSVDDSCDGCGICEQNCTGFNIHLEEGKPKWRKNCTMCMGCINRCPKEAIQYGDKTKGKRRYQFKEFCD